MFCRTLGQAFSKDVLCKVELRVLGISCPCRPGRGYEIILALTAGPLRMHHIALLRSALLVYKS